MNGKVAKRLRKEAYQDFSQKSTARKYVGLITDKIIVDKDKKEHKVRRTTIKNRGARAKYQQLKKEYYRGSK